AGGLRMLSRCPKDFPFQPGERIPQLIFGIRGSAPLRMPAIVRFVDTYATDVSGVILGVAFLDPTAADQEKVAQYVQARDREILRLLSIGLRSSAKAEPASWKGRIKRWWKT
ncbi:MAG: PilZ domain-containing protein, partial [Candidatus Igneacidithiobacillus chanchocoensis]